MDPAKEKKTYQIRVDAALLKAFLELAKSNERSPAGVIREFMREYIEKNTLRRAPWEGSEKDIPF